MTIPNPGSDEAVKEGCTCPRMDNSYGKGYMDENNFIILMGCPLHDTTGFTEILQGKESN